MHLVKSGWLKSLSFKILLAYVVGVVLSITLITLVTFWLLFYQHSYLSSSDATAFAREMSKKLQFDHAGKPIGFTDHQREFGWVFESLKKEAAYRILDESGRTVLSSEAGENFWPANDTLPKFEPGHFAFEKNGILIHAATSLVHHKNQTWHIQFGVSARFYHIMYRGFALPFMGVGIIVFSLVLFFVFGVCAYITLGSTLRPLRELSESASVISPRSIHERLRIEGVPYEIAPLVESFNHVLDRLEQGYRVQQDFLATAAHELKTPLALIRAQIEINTKGEDRDSLLDDVAHMARQVQQLLLLAEVIEEQNYSLIWVHIPTLVNDVATFLQPMTKAAKVEIVVDETQEARWLADRSALFVLIKNLLENAIQHAPQGTQVQVEINTDEVTVRDWGPGIKPEQLPHIFERFWRGAHRRDHGAGLGLSICNEIAMAHGWTLKAKNAEPGMCFLLYCNNSHPNKTA